MENLEQQPTETPESIVSTGDVIPESTPVDNSGANEAAAIVAKNLEIDIEDASQILNDDPEYLDTISKANKLGKYKDSGSDADSSKDSSATDADPDPAKEVEQPDDKPSGVDAASENLEFADNVIEGLTGEELSKISPAAQEAIGNFYQKSTETAEKLTEVETKLNRLLEDPIGKARAEAIESGAAPEKYNVRGLSNGEKISIAAAIKQVVGLDDEDAAKAVGIIEKALDVATTEMAQDKLNNMIIERDSKQKLEQANKRGMSILLQEFGKLNPNLKFDETDISKIYSLKEKHPEYKKFKEHLEPIRDLFVSKKMTYKDLADYADKFGVESLYAFVAKEKGYPVAINTKDRDAKIALENRKSALKQFFRSNSTGTLSTESSIGASRDNAANLAATGGYDPVKLATDEAYLQRAIESKEGDLKHLEFIVKLTEQGRKSLSSKKR